MKPQDATEYYEQRWNGEARANLWAMSRAAAILKEISKLDIHHPTVLDLGCGTGWLTRILNQFGTASGVDLAPGAARRFHPDLKFFGVDEDAGKDYDIVVSQEVLEHANDQTGYLKSAHNALKPSGYLVLTTPNATVSLRKPELLVQPQEKHLTRQGLRAALVPHFEIVELYSFFFGYAGWRPYRVQMRFGHWLNAGLHLMAVARRRD